MKSNFDKKMHEFSNDDVVYSRESQEEKKKMKVMSKPCDTLHLKETLFLWIGCLAALVMFLGFFVFVLD